MFDSQLARFLLFVSGIICGVLTAIQGSVNVSLGRLTAYGTLATLLSFSSGLGLLSIIVLADAYVFGNRPLLRWRSRPSIPLLLPGLLGVVYVSASIFLTSLVMGFALFWACVVAGQLTAAALFDANGLGVAGGVHIPVSRARLASLLLACGGVGMSMTEKISSASSSGVSQPPGVVVGACIASYVCGAGMLTQSVLNRRAADLLPSRLQATWWSFAIGTVAAACLFGIHAAVEPKKLASLATALARASLEQLSGGILGVVYVAGSIYIPFYLGSQTYAIALVSGQLLMSLAIDALGLFGADAATPGSLKLSGIAVVLFASILSQLVTTAPPAPVKNTSTESSPTVDN